MQLTNPTIPACVIDSIKDFTNVNTRLWCAEADFNKLISGNLVLLSIEHQTYLNRINTIQAFLWQCKETDCIYTLFLTTDINYPFAYIVIPINRFYTDNNIKLIFATIDQFSSNCIRMKQQWISDRKL